MEYRLHKLGTPYAFQMEKMSKFNTQQKWEKKLWNVHKIERVHIFNVWTIIVLSLNIKEWILLELQITQTRQPLSIADGKNV